MTLTTLSIKAVAQGNSATTVWPFTFLIPALADLVVTLVDVVSGNQTVVNPVNYSGTCWDYDAGGAAPAGFVYPIGQACTALYPDYRAKLVSAGSPYGTNGVDPLMPDRRSVVSAGKSNMGGVDNGLLPGGTVLGAVLGSATRVLLKTNLPPYTPVGVNTGGVYSHPVTPVGGLAGAQISVLQASADANVALITQPTFTGTPQGGLSTSFSIVQPTFICNKILKVH